MKIFFIYLVSPFIVLGCKNGIATKDQTTTKVVNIEETGSSAMDVYCSVPSSPTNNTEALYAEEVSQNTMAEKAFCELA